MTVAEDNGPAPRPAYGEGRQALLRAAIHVVAASGLRNLTYRAVAQEAGVTHGLVAHHFGSRDALLEEALRYSLEQSVEQSRLGQEPDSMEDFARDFATFVETDPEVQAFQYELILEARRRSELRPYVDELYAGYRKAAAEQLRKLGIRDQGTIEIAFAALDGLVFQQLATGDTKRTERGVRALRKLLSRST